MTVPAEHLLPEAISFAARKHQGQVRKDSRTPYFAHPVRVMLIVRERWGIADPEVLAAAVLHDTIEDTTTDYDDVARRFGPRVAHLVALLTKDKRLPEEEREEQYHAALAAGPLEAKLCKLADTLDNLLDCQSLTDAGRRRAVARARHVLAFFEPTMPPEWRHALAAVRERVAVVEGQKAECAEV
jgi:guanosine-3',5'-bis(diphosphate) 3'-pyrophosphohydrolase